MNRRSFAKTLLAGEIFPPSTSHGLLAGRAAQAQGTVTLRSAVSRALDIDGRGATVIGPAGPAGAPGLSLRAGQATGLDGTDALAGQAATTRIS